MGSSLGSLKWVAMGWFHPIAYKRAEGYEVHASLPSIWALASSSINWQVSLTER